jgi:hypothetical protein
MRVTASTSLRPCILSSFDASSSQAKRSEAALHAKVATRLWPCWRLAIELTGNFFALSSCLDALLAMERFVNESPELIRADLQSAVHEYGSCEYHGRANCSTASAASIPSDVLGVSSAYFGSSVSTVNLSCAELSPATPAHYELPDAHMARQLPGSPRHLARDSESRLVILEWLPCFEVQRDTGLCVTGCYPEVLNVLQPDDQHWRNVRA